MFAGPSAATQFVGILLVCAVTAAKFVQVRAFVRWSRSLIVLMALAASALLTAAWVLRMFFVLQIPGRGSSIFVG
jgi:hypothetical protein